MKANFIIFIGIAFSCNAQKNLQKVNTTDTIRYYSEQCKQYLTYERQYMNDSVYIEKHGDVSDTLMLNGNSLYQLHRDIKYKIIDVADFKNNIKYRYFYYGLYAADTVRRNNESDTQYKLRLYQSIVIYVPISITTVKEKEAFTYYILRECYPVTEVCIKSKIANGQYGTIYFEKEIGYTGHSAANEKCSYRITSESYHTLTMRNK